MWKTESGTFGEGGKLKVGGTLNIVEDQMDVNKFGEKLWWKTLVKNFNEKL